MSDIRLYDQNLAAPQQPMPEAPPRHEFNPVQWLHYVLRGRYHWALLLGAIFAVAAGYYMYNQVQLVYRAAGQIQIKSYLPRLMYGNEATGRMPNFESFVDQQVRLLREDRVVSMAMTSEPWRELGREFTPEAQQEFKQSLRVWHSGGGVIAVEFTHPEKEITAVAVRAVIEAYQQLFKETDPMQERRRMQLLDERRLSLANQLSSVRNQIGSFGDAFGPDGVKFRYQQGFSEMREIEESIRETELQLTAAEKRLEEGPPVPTLRDLAEDNPRLAELHEQLENRNVRLAALKREYDENHPAVIALQRQIEYVKQRIEDVAASTDVGLVQREWQEEIEERMQELKDRREELEAMREKSKMELAAVSEEKNRLERLEEEAGEIEGKLAQVQSRIEQLNVESAMGDRLEVISYGSAGSRPVNHKEPQEKAMMGAFAGGTVGVAVVMLLGLLNPKLRRSEDLSVSRGAPKVLGMLPHLPERLDNPEQAYFAGQCVHQIRMFLQLEGGGADLRSFVVTGPASGTGKTSLTMALGFSYAAAGAKTLLVDFDMVGAGLTTRLDVGRRKRLGRLLVEEGLVHADALADALADHESNKPIGEKLVERGLVSPEDVNRVLQLQQRSRVGLLDVLAGQSVDDCAVDLPAENLTLLSVGNATAEHISRVGRSAVKRFLKEVREKYEVVLIDTGPVPGSVEASLIAAEADRVVLAVSRGDQMRRLNECQGFLQSVGARVAGVVFNRAEARDMAKSSHSLAASVRSMSVNSRERNGTNVRRIGPVAVAAVGGLYEEQSDDDNN